MYESFYPSKEFREKRALVRHRVSLFKSRTMIENRIHLLLDKYDYRTDLSDIFGKGGIRWLCTLELSTGLMNLILNAIPHIPQFGFLFLIPLIPHLMTHQLMLPQTTFGYKQLASECTILYPSLFFR
ncbi:MAG: hypothetical protein KGI25_05455 [Thaumarchaeota archaeon]|nr:hypothetical protein [Nitrososphaerota archaeon]